MSKGDFTAVLMSSFYMEYKHDGTMIYEMFMGILFGDPEIHYTVATLNEIGQFNTETQTFKCCVSLK